MWVAFRKPNPAARLRLFCFPYAGGGATVFRDWGAQLPPLVEVCPIQLPGRETRLREPPLVRLETIVSSLLDALVPLLDRPYAFFGYSMGTLIAFELARALGERGHAPPRLLAVGGRCAPEVPGSSKLHRLPEAEFREALRRLGGTPEAVLAEPELMALMMPVLRADFAVAESYAYRQGPPLSCPLVVYGGDADPEAPPGCLGGWAAHSTGATRVRVFPGDHFFLHSARSLLLADLSCELEALLAKERFERGG